MWVALFYRSTGELAWLEKRETVNDAIEAFRIETLRDRDDVRYERVTEERAKELREQYA